MKKTLLVACLVSPATAWAGGIVVGEAGSQAMERAGAFVAKADDPTALSANPAGIVKSRGIEIYIGANLLNMDLTFQRSGVYPSHPLGAQPAYVGSPYPEVSNDATFQVVPYLAATQRIGNLAFSEGLFAPSGVPNRDFPCKVDDLCQVTDNGAPAPNRYDVVKQTALVAYPSLAVAYRVHPMLDLGARVSWGFASVKARNFPWALPNKPENPKAEGDFNTSVSDNFVFGYGFGVLFRPTSSIEIGAQYTGPKTVEATGTGDARLGDEVNPLGDQVFIEPNPPGDQSEVVVRCAAGGRISELKSCVNFKLPMTATLGVRYIFEDHKNGGERADIELDFGWENWSKASDDEILVNGRDTFLMNSLKPVFNRHGFKDTFSVRLGGAYKLDVGKDALTLRGGVSHDTAAASDGWTRLDKDGKAKTLLSVGAAYDLGRWRFDLGFGYAILPTITVTNIPNPSPTYDNREQPDPLQPSMDKNNTIFYPINAGRYESSYLIGSLGVTASF